MQLEGNGDRYFFNMRNNPLQENRSTACSFSTRRVTAITWSNLRYLTLSCSQIEVCALIAQAGQIPRTLYKVSADGAEKQTCAGLMRLHHSADRLENWSIYGRGGV